MSSHYSLVSSTFPDRESARAVIGLLLDRHLAACIHTLPVTSHYRWEGNLHEDKEVLVLIKTKRSLYEQVETLIASHHPYDCPEIVHTSIDGGLAPYLNWISKETESCKDDD